MPTGDFPTYQYSMSYVHGEPRNKYGVVLPSYGTQSNSAAMDALNANLFASALPTAMTFGATAEHICFDLDFDITAQNLLSETIGSCVWINCLPAEQSAQPDYLAITRSIAAAGF